VIWQSCTEWLRTEKPIRGHSVHSWQRDWQTPRTPVTIVCISCIRCRLLLPMFAVSVSQSVCHECTEWPRLGFTVRGHSVQPCQITLASCTFTCYAAGHQEVVLRIISWDSRRRCVCAVTIRNSNTKIATFDNLMRWFTLWIMCMGYSMKLKCQRCPSNVKSSGRH